MKVLSLVTTSERSFYREQCRALDARGIEWTTLGVPGRHRAADDGTEERTLLDYARYWPLVLHHAADDYDLIHANYGLTAPFAVAQPWLPSVVTLWGGEFERNRFAPLVRASVDRCDALIVATSAITDGWPGKRVEIPFPVDTELFRPISRARARRRVGWDEDARIVLFLYARSRYEKNYELAKHVVSDVDGATLRTIFDVPYEEVPYYVNASDAVLVTSRWESGPMTVKEATACNVPVVSTDVGFVADVLENVEGSFVRSSKAGLTAALEDVLRRRGRVDGREGIREYTREEMGRRLERVYERCLR